MLQQEKNKNKSQLLNLKSQRLILITGGAGFIGSNFICYILEKYSNYKVINLDALTYAGNLNNLRNVEDNSNYTFVHGNITDKNLVNKLVAKTDLIVHFAAESHVDRSIEDSDTFVRTNINGTLNLLEAAKSNGNKRFHHISTDEVYGSLDKDEPAFNEDTAYDPRSPYSASKASSDHLVRAYYHTHQLPVTISNCSNNYGPYQFPEKLIPFFVTNLIDNKKIPVYGTGQAIRDWLHVKDHCRAIDLIMHEGELGETYCVGGNAEKTNMEITNTVLNIMDKSKKMIEYVTDRKGHDMRYAIDFSKLKNKLGWEPVVTFEEGMKETIQWYKDNEQWWRDIQSGKYQNN